MSATQEHVYMLWDCGDCGEEGIVCSPDGRYCPSCGHVRTFEEFDNAYLPGNDATWDQQNHHVIPPDVLERLMNAGPSWFCTNCTADNYGDQSHCHSCNAPRAASDEELRGILDERTFRAYMDGDRGATADLVQAFGEYAGMRAAHGESFDLFGALEDQLEDAQRGRSAFREEMDGELHHVARPAWDESDLPSSVESFHQTHGEDAYTASVIETRLHAGEDGSLGEDVYADSESYRDELPSAKRPPMRVQPVEDAWHQDDENHWSNEDEEEYVNFFAEQKRRRRRFGGIIAAVLSGIAALVGGVMYWGNLTNEYSGKITSLPWERHVYEDRWTDVTLEDWEYSLSERPEIEPVNGQGEQAEVDIIPCHDRHHHYEDYVCGTEQVPCTHEESYTESYSCDKTESYTCGEECSTTRGSNGIATRTCVPKTCTRTVSSTCTETKYRKLHSSDTVDKICQRSIERSFCSYHTQVWQQSAHHVDRGTRRPARWPASNLDHLERERREATYGVVIEYEKGGEVREIEKELELSTFQKWRVGDEIIAVVTNFGSLRSIHPPGSQEPIE